MAIIYKLKRTSTPKKIPTTNQLTDGEMAVNVFDGKLYIRKNNGVSSIIQVNNSVADTFVDVVTNGTFTINAAFGTVVHQSKLTDINNLYDSNTGLYTVPSTGIYHISGTMRCNDSNTAYKQWGMGVHTSNADGGWFLWHAVQNTTSGANRTTFPYVRVGFFNQGQQLRMIAYSDTGALSMISAAMQIYRTD